MAMRMPAPALDDAEGDRVDASLPPVVDAHVHLFPDPVFAAIWRWFDEHGWPIRHKLKTPEVISFLLDRGVSHIVALHYAHKPGMARGLNAYLAEVCKNEPRVTGMATVLPGEPGARAILEEAFALGLEGVKLHCHVQCFSPDAPELHEIWETCILHDLPAVVHAGREPKPEEGALACDPYELCAVERVERVLLDHPKLRLCVPHLGADEFDGYLRLLERHDNLWLDTTMMLAEYFPIRFAERLLTARPDRILYGTDFPNIPYAWDRELVRVRGRVKDSSLPQILGANARDLYRIGDLEAVNG
ncbi:MAG: amidohydrolase [Myxococcaceae bacterium]|nr:amidohydrolase [Myxococcaceae bacterium]